MTIVVATSAITTIMILLAVGYALHEMGILQPKVHDYEEEYNELRGDVQTLKEELAEARKVIALYEQLEKIETPFEDWVDDNLVTAEVVETALAHWTQLQRDRKDNLVKAVKSTEIAVGIGGFRLIRPEHKEPKKIYVAYPPEDAEVQLQTISLKRV